MQGRGSLKFRPLRTRTKSPIRLCLMTTAEALLSLDAEQLDRWFEAHEQHATHSSTAASHAPSSLWLGLGTSVSVIAKIGGRLMAAYRSALAEAGCGRAGHPALPVAPRQQTAERVGERG